jgi:hypothetical protein
MQTILKLALGALLILGTVQAGRAAIKHYAFVDAIQEAMLFVGSRTEEELVDRVMEIAGDHEVPLEYENITVRREAFQVLVDGTYTETIELIPRIWSRPWDFTIDVDVRLLEDTRPRQPAQRRRR